MGRCEIKVERWEIECEEVEGWEDKRVARLGESDFLKRRLDNSG